MWRNQDEPSAEHILERSQWVLHRPARKGKPVGSFVDLKDDGSTAYGAWIYSGVFAPTGEHPEGLNRAANRQCDEWSGSPGAGRGRSIGGFCTTAARPNPQGRLWAKEARLAGEFAKSGGSACPWLRLLGRRGQEWVGLTYGTSRRPRPHHVGQDRRRRQSILLTTVPPPSS